MQKVVRHCNLNLFHQQGNERSKGLDKIQVFQNLIVKGMVDGIVMERGHAFSGWIKFGE